MDESIRDTPKAKETSKMKKYLSFGKLVVIVLGIYWICTVFLIILTPENLMMTPINQLISLVSQIFKYEGKIDVNFISLDFKINFAALIILILLLYFQKFIRKESLSNIGIKNPRGEMRNVIFSIIGSFTILLIGWYFIFYFPFQNLNISLFVKLIPFTILDETAQEIIFRGIIQTEAMDKFGKWKGIFIASIIFSLNHIFSQKRLIKTLIITFLNGMWWGYLYSKNRNLTSPIIGHIFANILGKML